MQMRLKLTASVLAGLLCATGAQAQQAYSLAYISPVASQPGQQVITSALQAVSEANGWEWRSPDAALSADRQVSHVDTLITLGVSAIASWSLDPNAVAGAYTRANEAGIPVIGINSEGIGVTNTVWWEVNNCTPGNPHQRTAEWIAERAPGAQVIVMGGPPAPSILANVACFRAAAEAAGLVILDQVDNTRDSAANGATLAADMLTRHPGVQAFWAYNDQSALGISSAVFAAGRTVYTAANTDGVMVFGINGDDDAIQAVRDNRLTGTWDADYYATGFAMALAMKNAIENPGVAQTPLTVRSVLYTADNIADWRPAAERGYSLDSLPLVE